MARIKVNKTGFEAEADLSAIGDVTLKHLPKIIINWWRNKRNRKIVDKAIIDIRKQAFGPWKKHIRKFRVYNNFSLPRSIEQTKAQSEYDIKHINEPWHKIEFENRLKKDMAHFNLYEKFQEENGGKDNFGTYLERAIGINGFTVFPSRKVYTYSKKEKAVFILEEFRPYDNSYNIFVHCTKNWANI
ncbi:MAG: hypothetical protein FWD47_06740 [Treponema sp.]|nr:hypothetical protein [Treponema sp.]